MKTLGKILSLDLTKGNKQCIVNFAENPIFSIEIYIPSDYSPLIKYPCPLQRRPRTIMEGTGSYRPRPIDRVFSPLQTSNYVKCRHCLFKRYLRSLCFKECVVIKYILVVLYLMLVEEISNSAYQTQKCDRVKTHGGV